MNTAKQFTRWLDTNRSTLPADILPLAEQARLSLTQMEMDPRSNEQSPSLRAANLEDIRKFYDAMSARRS